MRYDSSTFALVLSLDLKYFSGVKKAYSYKFKGKVHPRRPGGGVSV
jgi:hypothetical protein